MFFIEIDGNFPFPLLVFDFSSSRFKLVREDITTLKREFLKNKAKSASLKKKH
jgi:hypothetical protein